MPFLVTSFSSDRSGGEGPGQYGHFVSSGENFRGMLGVVFCNSSGNFEGSVF